MSKVEKAIEKMNIPEKQSLSSSDRRDLMANERTFLSWIRTSIGIMAFGFVVEKFALFVKEIGAFFSSQGLTQTITLSPSHQSYTSIFGIFLVAIGALIGFISFINYKSAKKQIEENNYTSSSTLSTALMLLVLFMGIFLVIYLFSTR